MKILIGCLISVAILTLVCIGGCNDTERARMWDFNKKYHITLYANNGNVIREWDSSQNVESEGSSGWYFVSGNKMTFVSGTVVVEQK